MNVITSGEPDNDEEDQGTREKSIHVAQDPLDSSVMTQDPTSQ